MIFDVSHRTAYVYRKPVLQSQHLVHLTPRASPRQSVLRHSLLIEPAPSAKVELPGLLRQRKRDPDDRRRAFRAVIHARSTVEVSRARSADAGAFDAVGAGGEQALRRRGTSSTSRVLQFVSASRHTRVVPRRSTTPALRSRRTGRSWRRRWT